MGVPNPSAYKRQQGMNYRHPASDRLDDLWPDSSVRRILRNPLYTGTMVQGKNRTKSYKLHVSEAVPEDEWITVEQTHEAIIPGELFAKAQVPVRARYAHRTHAAARSTFSPAFFAARTAARR